MRTATKNYSMITDLAHPYREIPRKAFGKVYEVHPVNEAAHLGSAPANQLYEITKRTMDIVVASLALTLASPLMILIAISIKLDSEGPVLFRQMRIGRNRRRRNDRARFISDRRNGHNVRGQQIFIYKFRTMWLGVHPYAVCPQSPTDERLTRVGKILRRFCLDELPQLFNVLKGDLSMIGPRPEMPFIVAQYGPLECQRLLIRPGLTGLWQLHGSRTEPIHENLHYDLEYLQNRGLLLDLKILAKTLVYVFNSKNF